MTTSLFRGGIAALLAFAALATAPVLSAAGAVVVSNDSVQGPMDKAAVQAAFLGRTPQIGGQPTQVVFQKGPVRAPFESAVLARPGAQLTSHWSRLVFTGRAKAPQELADDAAVKAAVKATPGAIGYISEGAIDGSVKVLFRF